MPRQMKLAATCILAGVFFVFAAPVPTNTTYADDALRIVVGGVGSHTGDWHPPETGACCLPDGTCISIWNEVNCNWHHGDFHGAGSICPQPSNCPISGACCVGDTCYEAQTQDDCTAKGGHYLGDLSTCIYPNKCPIGACCVEGACTETTHANCQAAGAVWIGGESCRSGSCPPLGACCVGGNHCVPLVTEEKCLSSKNGGVWQGANTPTCENCDPTGACCVGGHDCRTGMTEAECTSPRVGGVWQGDYSNSCKNCDPIGACCVGGDTCVPGLTAAQCTASSVGGVWQGKDATVCTDCPILGACCVAENICYSEITEADCWAIEGSQSWQGYTNCAAHCPGVTEVCDVSHGPSQCHGGDNPQGPAILPSASTCNAEAGQFESKCWFSSGGIYTQWPNSGFPLNINLWQAFGPADYPPLKTDPQASSVPLVSGEVRHFVGPAPYRERVTLNDVVDLATGMPLLQATDFELPFGGATFRHIRTYSENASQFMLRQQFHTGAQPPQGTFWDWNGMFWMMSENPILLIDMQYRDFANNAIPGPEPRCYLIPDAHHAIPFIKDEGGNYTAPAWFDAILLPGPLSDNRPTEFYVFLNRRTIKYTFEVHYEDLWKEHGVNVHEPASAGGFGLPYYGLVKEISDRYGNKIKYDYCAQHQWDCDDVLYPPVVAEPLHTPCCKECCQNCNEKGQISRIQLETAKGEIAWTLLYTHRAFFHRALLTSPSHAAFYQHALHTIHVYPGNVSLPDGTTCLTIDPDLFCTDQSMDHVGAVETINHPVIAAWEANSNGPKWTIEARYVYADGGSLVPSNVAPFDQPSCERDRVFKNAVDADDVIYFGGRLLKVMVSRRDPAAASAEPADKRFTMYRYKRTTDAGGLNNTNAETYLQAVYEDATIKSMVKAREQKLGVSGITPNFIFDIPNGPSRPESPDPNELAGYMDFKTGEVKSKPLSELADIFMVDTEDPGPNGVFGQGIKRGRDLSLITQFLQNAPTSRTKPNGLSRTFLRDRRPNSPGNGAYHLYYFVSYPEIPGHQAPTWPRPRWDYWGSPLDIIYHYPYRMYYPWESDDDTPKPGGVFDVPQGTPFFGIIIDKESKKDSNDVYYVGQLPESEGDAEIPARGIERRRVIELNSAGFVLRDRTWEMANGTLQQTQQSGGAELYAYDSEGRVTEIRSRGWDSAANQDSKAGQGLIKVFQYFPSGDAKGELMAEGFKQGTESQTYYTKRYERGVSGRPELVTREVVFPTPESNMNAASDSVTTTEYTHQNQSDPNTPLLSKKITRPGVRWTADPDNQAEYKAVENSLFDDNGNTVWLAVGSINASNSNDVKEMYLNYTSYDKYGRPLVQIVDADPRYPADADPLLEPGEEYSTTPWQVALPSSPGWQRTVPDNSLQPLKLITKYAYHPVWGLVRTRLPNCRENRTFYVENYGVTGVTQWIYTDVLFNSNTDWKTLSPVRIRTFEAGKLREEKQVRLTESPSTPLGPQDDNNLEVLSALAMSWDEDGRPAGVEQKDSGDATQLQTTVGFDSNGDLTSQHSPDGTITRHVYDALGRLRGTYRGTNDIHEFWGTGIVCTGLPGDPTDCYQPEDFPDNMVLIEKRSYGDGSTDINSTGQLVEIRNYRDKPENQYPIVDPFNPENSQYSNEDHVGWTTRIEYDWRMRPVWEQHRSSSTITPGENGSPPTYSDGDALTHKLTWYDNLDRVRFEAEYGATAPEGGNADPRNAAPNADVPPASDILATSPISLTETKYNARGQAEEVRHYNVAVQDGTSYTATVSCFNHLDKPVEVHSPNAPTQRYVYDAKGRQVRSSAYAGGRELTRSQTLYDLNDRAIATIYRERVNRDGAELDEPDTVNSVKSYTQTWYDKAGKVLATVNYGTNSTNDTFTSGVDPINLNAAAPVVYAKNGTVNSINYAAYAASLLTCYEYDKAGRQCAVYHPDKTVTRTVYDDLGRVKETWEGETFIDNGSDLSLVQGKLYQYDTQGRLISINSAIRGTGGAATAQQTTEIIYAATVVGSTGAQMSANNGFIGEVRFPDPTTGEPTADDSIRFTYYSDGSVATRTDQRGIVFTHQYDELGRRTQTGINDEAWFTPPAADQPDNRPPNRIHHLVYSYKTDGSLEKVSAFTSGEGGAEFPVAENLFEYDTRGNLVADYQEHGGTVTLGVTPKTGYAWVFGRWDLDGPPYAFNGDRLSTINYPQHDGSPLRGVTYEYDWSEGSGNQITGIIRSGDALARYGYAGLSRRMETVWGGDPVYQSFNDGGTGQGLDRFGRVKDLHFKDMADGTIHRYQYGYNASGNRTYARVTQWPTDYNGDGIPDATHENDRSYLYGYDSLNRLIKAEMGALTADNVAIATGAPAPPPLTTEWGLDILGNWTGKPGDVSNPGVKRTGDFDGDGTVDATPYLTHHEVNSANQITGLSDYVEGDLQVSQAIVSDAAGNLVSDGIYYFQYDAWNRLIQVNYIGSALVAPDDSLTGVPRGTIASGDLGDLVCRYTYDGLGRLITKQNPVIVDRQPGGDPRGGSGGGGTTVSLLQAKDYYYDGVRRIQEVISRPLLENPNGSQGSPSDPNSPVSDIQNDELPMLRGGDPPPEENPPPRARSAGDLARALDRPRVRLWPRLRR